MIDAALRSTLQHRLGGPAIVDVRALSGGDINDAYALRMADGGRYFMKTNAGADATMFETEARGLELLRAADALAIPEVVLVGRAPAPYLVLEFVEPGSRMADFDEALGRGLAALHRAGEPRFGLDHDNFIGRLPQSNEQADSWVDFFRDRRLRPLIDSARRELGSATCDRFEQLMLRLDDLCGPVEPPALLHGDLWGGNLHCTAAGQPCLIDPAVYNGHREIDLAMMRLFGGFSQRCFDAYAEAYPLAEGAPERVSLYQLYPLLVHVNLFGGSYVASVRSALGRYL